MDLLSHAVQAYNFLLVLVDIILGTIFGNIYGLGALAVLLLAVPAAAYVLLRRRTAAARPAKTPPP